MIKFHNRLVHLIILIIATYFLAKKVVGISISHLLKYVFNENVVPDLINGLIVISIYALLAKIGLFIYEEFFKTTLSTNIKNPHYRCLLNNNEEIGKHIKELKKGTFKIESIMNNHAYEYNIQIIHSNLSEHLIDVLKDENITNKDVFFSLFHQKEINLEDVNIKEFEYVSHFDPTIHHTSTSTLNLEEQTSFAAVQAIKKKKTIICHKVKSGNYVVGKEERRRTVKHYMGFPLQINGTIVAVLNIEFHNNTFFKNEKEMKEFISREIDAFIYLYEYQIYKKYFFDCIKQKGSEI